MVPRKKIAVSHFPCPGTKELRERPGARPLGSELGSASSCREGRAGYSVFGPHLLPLYNLHSVVVGMKGVDMHNRALKLYLASDENSVVGSFHHGTDLCPFSPNLSFLYHNSKVFHIRKDGRRGVVVFRKLGAFLKK